MNQRSRRLLSGDFYLSLQNIYMFISKAFKIRVRYQGRLVAAVALFEEVPKVLQFIVVFPDGYKNSFYCNDDVPESIRIWQETSLGVTQLSKDVGEVLDQVTTKLFWLKQTNQAEPEQLGDELNF